jgi:hypothetical protein
MAPGTSFHESSWRSLVQIFLYVNRATMISNTPETLIDRRIEHFKGRRSMNDHREISGDGGRHLVAKIVSSYVKHNRVAANASFRL